MHCLCLDRTTIVFAACGTLAACLAAFGVDARAADSGAGAAALARQILDDSRPEADRKKDVLDHPKLSLDLLKAMVADLPAGDLKEEYRRIPWIWRVAIAAAKRKDLQETRSIVDFALPKEGESLRDWQAVVLGGGIINGITLAGNWPDEEIKKIVAEDPALKPRWQQLLKLAAKMADNKQVFKGTRYDALRIIGVDSWNHRGAELFRYLQKGVDDELMQGAIGGLGDMRSPCSGQAILSGYAHYNQENRGFALNALLRDEHRVSTLLDAIEAGTVKPGDLGPERTAKLTAYPNVNLRARAAKLLGKEG